MYKFQVSAWKKLVLLLLLSACVVTGRAQIYPVQLSTLVSPPYSIYLPDYASPGGEKLRLVLLQRDLTVQGYRVRFEMKIQVNGVTIMQTSRSAMPPPITLQPGIPTVLGGSDLSWYVQPQNLEFGGGYSSSTYEQSRSLPEGPISITFTAYDYTRSDLQVSASAGSFFYATRDNPPLLNYPACGMQVTPISPQFLNFSWLPQNTSSPNSALQTNYIFSLWAVLPAGYNFQDIVQSTRPLYSVTTQMPTLVYGPGQPPLVPGQSYAWRVQAVDITGRDVFRNSGYSETCNFNYVGDNGQGIVSYPAIQVNAASAGTAQGKVWWTVGGGGVGTSGSGGGLAASGYDQYRLYYRKLQGNYDWFSVDVNDSIYRVFDLEPSTTYECRLQGHKNGSYGPYTDVINFTTDAPKTIGCTDNTSMLNPYSGRPLAIATSGMNITYGPWDVQLLTVQPLGSPGRFRGTCKVAVPFMGSMTFNAKFDNLTIDDSRNVTAGNIVFLSQGLQAWVDSSIHEQMGGDLYGKVVSGTDTTNVTVGVSLANLDHLDVVDSSNGDIKSITLPDNSTFIVPDGLQELTIKDASGNTYSLDNQGNLTQLSLSDPSLQNFFSNPENVAQLNTISSGVGTVTFKDVEDAKYAFDAWKPFYGQASTLLTGQYEKLTGSYGDYYVPQKAIGAGESDLVGLDIDLPDNMDEDSLIFATSTGTRLIWDPNDYTLNLLGGPAADAQEIYALYPKPGGGYYSLAKLLVSAYEHKDFTAVLVPVVGGDGAAPVIDRKYYEDSLNSIYNKVNVSWTVELASAYTNTDWDADGDGLLTMTGSSFLSNKLTGEPAALIKAYKNSTSADNSKRYLFILNTSSGSTGETGGLQGDMPRATAYGFVFLKANAEAGEDPAVALAHELGHGQFNLEHTFSGDIALGTQGATAAFPNLMDYQVGNHVYLYKYQWNQVHQPGQVMGILEGDAAGQMSRVNLNVFKPFANADGSYTFITPSGRYISLPSTVTAVYFSTYDKVVNERYTASYYPPIGSLIAFDLNNNEYTAVYSGDSFSGFECQSCQATCSTCTVIKHYTETLSGTLKPQTAIVLFTAVEDSAFVAYAGQYASTTSGNPLPNEDGAGTMGKNLFVINTSGADLTQNYKDYLSGVLGTNKLRITDANTLKTWIDQDYNVTLDKATGATVTNYLLSTLNSNSTLGEVLAQFALVFEGADAIKLFKSCETTLTSQLWKQIDQKFKAGLMGNQDMQTYNPLEKHHADTLEAQLQRVGIASSQDLAGANQLSMQVSNAQSMDDVYTAITLHYNECTFRGVELATRNAMLNWIFKSSFSKWSWLDTNLVYTILRTAPAEQQLPLLQGFMADEYSWLRSLWATSSLAYATPVVNILSGWVRTYQGQLGIAPTQKTVAFNNIMSLGSYRYPAGDKPYIIGLKVSEDFNVAAIHTAFSLGPNNDAGTVKMTADGRITFSENYMMMDISDVITSVDNPVTPTKTYFAYEEKYDPFELVRIVFVDDNAPINVTKGTSYVMPAIWAYWAITAKSDNFQSLSTKINWLDFFRTFVNAAAVVTALESGGESMNLASALNKIAAVAAGMDQMVLTAEKLGIIPASQADNLNAWKSFSNTLQIANGMTAAFRSANYESVAAEWNSFDNILGQNAAPLSPVLQDAWGSMRTLMDKVSQDFGVLSQDERFGRAVANITHLQMTLKSGMSIGNATELQLYCINRYTISGDLNDAFRAGDLLDLSSVTLDPVQKAMYTELKNGLANLRQTDRLYTNYALRGRRFSQSEFDQLFKGDGTEVPLKGFVSATKRIDVAKAFWPKTGSNGADEKINVILKIKSLNGVYIDDLSEYGVNLGPIQHPNDLIQYEVLMEEGYFKQVGSWQTITEDGTTYRLVELQELGKPLRTIN